MKLLLLILALGSAVSAYSQDIIKMHNGGEEKGVVEKIDNFTITFTREGERAERTLSKFAVDRIVYESGKEEIVSEKIGINSEEDWEKVIILLDHSQTGGLKETGEIKGNTSFVANFHTGTSGDRKAEKKLKMAAAGMGCPFVYITSDKDKFLSHQTVKRGIAYSY